MDINAMQVDTDIDAQTLGSELIKHITEGQALGVALAETHRDKTREDSDAMEEDETIPKTKLGSLTSSEEGKTPDPDSSPSSTLSSSSSSSSLLLSSSLLSSSSSKEDEDEDEDEDDSLNSQQTPKSTNKNQECSRS
jgi:hypothetical protein